MAHANDVGYIVQGCRPVPSSGGILWNGTARHHLRGRLTQPPGAAAAATALCVAQGEGAALLGVASMVATATAPPLRKSWAPGAHQRRQQLACRGPMAPRGAACTLISSAPPAPL